MAILDVGAYGTSMASEYNMRPLPAEVLLQEENGMSVIRKRMTSAELVDRFMEETSG